MRPAARTGSSFDSTVLWYTRPAKNWVEALPLGNGRLGAMIFGDPAAEHVQFNEESLWSGFPWQALPG